VSVGKSQAGVLLLDPALNAVAANPDAIQILAFPGKPDRIKRLDVYLADRVRAILVEGRSESLEFVREFRSGSRIYTCKAFRLDAPTKGARLIIALLLERTSSGRSAALSDICQRFDLTQRERETVELLLQGLTSKEIANRMNISPNTVKAFLRLVMVKMGVSTRAGIVGRVVSPS
jgi:DNA-binding CsgD family transcriptional regulator